ELPAKSMDLAAVNLTELVNNMLGTTLKGPKNFFSLLSVTSYSSFAFHKVSVTVYNISNLKNVDPGKFPTRHCYCLNNMTNDLTDFTALLVDILGNSTSYLTEIFKSTSILSVNQSNNSDCIYICMMTGRTGRNLSDFWEMLDKLPAINYTFSSNTSADMGKYSIFSSSMKLQEDSKKIMDASAEHMWRPKSAQCLYFSPATRIPAALKGEEIPLTRVPSWPKTSGVKGSGFQSLENWDVWKARGTAGAMKEATATAAASEYCTDKTFWHCSYTTDLTLVGPSKLLGSGRRVLHFSLLPPAAGAHAKPCCGDGDQVYHLSWFITSPSQTLRVSGAFHSTQQPTELSFFLGCPQAILKESLGTSTPITVITQKINPCVMELCRFFQLCLCVSRRRYSRKEAMRYCVEYYSWFLKNASYVCEKVKRVAYSQTLKQKCLANICKSI
ncbi:HHLA1 protein, partial [Nothocercus nigrocapillus]|nr:HHLA1 protein [Nothocercus nigrocapillus]